MHNVNQIRSLMSGTLAILMAGTATNALAQTATEEADPNEIIVTANKRSENLQNVPISV